MQVFPSSFLIWFSNYIPIYNHVHVLRSKKLSVLIHNSDTHPNVQSCKVAVHFQEILDKGDSFEVVPNSEFYVSRTANKDNSSFYTVRTKSFI